jgi:hypothetical protein
MVSTTVQSEPFLFLFSRKTPRSKKKRALTPFWGEPLPEVLDNPPNAANLRPAL